MERGTTKNGEPREFPFDVVPALKAMLEAQLARRAEIERETGAEVDYVFPVPDATHRDVRYKRLRKAWRAACRKAGQSRLILHDLRRTAVRNFELAGISRSVGKLLSGHKTDSVYNDYAVTDSVVQRDGARKLAGLLPPTV